jgi:hypothetical protein
VGGARSESALATCLRSADLLAPIRPWIGQIRLRRTIYDGRLDEADALCCRWVIEFFREHDIPVHPFLRERDRAFRRGLGAEGGFCARW